MGFLGIEVTDRWLLLHRVSPGRHSTKQRVFYEQLAYELVRIAYDTVGFRSNNPGPNLVPTTLYPSAGVVIHLTPTKKTKKHRNGTTVIYLSTEFNAFARCARSIAQRKHARNVQLMYSYATLHREGTVSTFAALHVMEETTNQQQRGSPNNLGMRID